MRADMQCWRLVESIGTLPEHDYLKVGAIARFANGKPIQAVWNDAESDWVPLRWEKCDDPRAVTFP